MTKRVTCAAFVLLLVGACGGPRIVASAFDQGCNADADCIAVRVGSPCDCVQQYDGISKNEQARYDEASRGLFSEGARAACSSCREVPDVSVKAICSARKCTAVVTRNR